LPGPVLRVQHLGSREAGEDLDAERFGLLGQPAHHVAQADDVVAVVAEAVREQEERRRRGAAAFLEEQEAVGRDRLIQRRPLLLPVGNQLAQSARIHDRAGQDVRAGLGPLLEHDNRDLLRTFGGELLQTDRRRQTGRAGANDGDVVLHRFAGAVRSQDLVGCHVFLATKLV
jgi:hypothetical protein